MVEKQQQRPKVIKLEKNTSRVVIVVICLTAVVFECLCVTKWWGAGRERERECVRDRQREREYYERVSVMRGERRSWLSSYFYGP